MKDDAFKNLIAIAQVVQCEVVLKDSELPYGEVTGGFLVLRTALIPCLTLFNYGWDKASVCRSPHAQHEQHSKVYDILESRLKQWFEPDFADRLERGRLEWHLAPLMRKEEPNHAPYVYGLILELTNTVSGTHTENGKVYRRVGFFRAANLWRALKAENFPLVEVEII